MTPAVLTILIVTIWLGLGCGAAAWFFFRLRRPAKDKLPPRRTATAGTFSFRWSYIILPAAILLLSIILAAFFYPQLSDKVAYHFTLNGAPDRWLSRETVAAWMLAPQLIFTLLAGAIALGTTRLSMLSRRTEGAGTKPEAIVALMGNMVALPQIILCFAMFDIFSYNLYRIHIMPLWIFAVIIMGLGAIILVTFFVVAMRRAWRATRRPL